MLRTRTLVPAGSGSDVCEWVATWLFSTSAVDPDRAQSTDGNRQCEGEQGPRAKEDEHRHHHGVDDRGPHLETEDAQVVILANRPSDLVSGR